MTIIDKLKLSRYTHMAVLNDPADYNLFTDYPPTLSTQHDAIFIFIETVEDMKRHADHIINNNLLLENGYLFFAYPKKGNKRFSTYVHRDEIFPSLKVGEDGYMEGSDVKFSRMVSMDEVFTVVGLKRQKKKAGKSSAASQCIADYENQVEDVKALLAEHPNELAFYEKLTPGYQKDWARQIFSAKQEKTREKRRQQMVEVLGQGYKTLDLYRRKT
ncbi:YdeI/OmpD-associated family protein [Halobacillus sp. A5]|uniref:YdeI/OmpD-associated family protein n=1 Tax=Halobacillus sp. A5 TaxID=2880263 RepID=UPI0020A63C30|nr:YdeI/OmpD-associated family protein [Halobacillus sp. A5]MCP3027170.1 YdeI/OmpD-associated family protein [Halobacillus sp. A5]